MCFHEYNKNRIQSVRQGIKHQIKIVNKSKKALYFPTLQNSNIKLINNVDTQSFKTFSAKPSDIDKKWVLIDAEGQPLGRLCSKIASILRGKHKPTYTPHMDTGDHVVVINAEKVTLSGDKMNSKEYFRHTGYPGGERFKKVSEVLEKDPEFLVMNAVKGMLPKNRLGRKQLTNLRVYAGPVHPHTAQQPEKTD